MALRRMTWGSGVSRASPFNKVSDYLGYTYYGTHLSDCEGTTSHLLLMLIRKKASHMKLHIDSMALKSYTLRRCISTSFRSCHSYFSRFFVPFLSSSLPFLSFLSSPVSFLSFVCSHFFSSDQSESHQA